MKLFAKIIAALLVVIIIAGAVAVWMFDPNDYKDAIAEQVEQQTGRHIDITGDIKLSVFPWLGIELGRIELANADGFGDEPMAEMDGMQVHIKLLPLLKKQVKLGKIDLNGLHLRLAKNANGVTNWDDILQHLAEDNDDDQSADMADAKAEQNTDSAEVAADEEPNELVAELLANFEVAAINIKNANVAWQDDAAGQKFLLRDFNLHTGKIALGEPFDLTISAAAEDQINDLTAELKLSTKLFASLEDEQYRFADLNIKVDAQGETIPAGQQSVQLTADGRYNGQQASFALQDLNITAAGVQITGHANGQQLDTQPKLSGQLTVKSFSPKQVLNKLAVELPEFSSDDALSKLAMDMHFSATTDSAQLDDLQIQFDQTTLRGKGGIANFAHPKISFDMAVDQFNLDDYLPPASDDDEAATQQASAEVASDADATNADEQVVDVSFLKGFDLDGHFSLDKLTAFNMQVSNADLKIQSKDGLLNISPLAAQFYDGDIKLYATVDARPATPKYSLKTTVSGVQFEPLLEDAIDKGLFSGNGNIDVDVHTQGQTVYALKRGLNGHAGFKALDGEFKYFDLKDLVDRKVKEYKGEAVDSADPKTRTAFKQFGLTTNIIDGVVHNDDLALSTSEMAATGAGQYDVADDVLDYQVSLTINENVSGTLRHAAGLTIPIKLTGPIAEPQYSLGIKDAITGYAKQKAKEKLKAEEEKAKKKAKEKLKAEEEKAKKKAKDKIDAAQEKAKDKAKDKLEKKVGDKLKSFFK